MITLVYAYYENPVMFAFQQDVWAAYPQHLIEKINLIVVDDGSQREPAKKYWNPVFESARLYRVDVNIPWNQNGARNLAMLECGTEWALMTDMDHVLYPADAERMLTGGYMSGKVYMPQRLTHDRKPYKRHPNSFLIEKELFWQSGGYDEDFAGYYGTDIVFRKAVGLVGEIVETDGFALVTYVRDQIPDASTTDFGRKGSKYHTKMYDHFRLKKDGPAYKATNHVRFPWTRIY